MELLLAKIGIDKSTTREGHFKGNEEFSSEGFLRSHVCFILCKIYQIKGQPGNINVVDISKS